MPCGVTTTTVCATPVNNLLFECCDRLKLQAFKCEAPTGCAGATFPVGLQINVNEWPSMGEYPVYALKLFDCVGGKAQVGLLGAVNGTVKYGVDVKIPNTAEASAIKLTIVDPVSGVPLPGQSMNIGLAPATNTADVSSTGTTSPALTLDGGLSVLGPFEAVIGEPDRNAWDGLWSPSSSNDQGILITTEQRQWDYGGAKVDTGFSVVKTKEDDGFAGTYVDILSRSMVGLAGSDPNADTTVGLFATAANETPAAGGINAAIWTWLNNNWTTQIAKAGLSVKTPDGNTWSGWFSENIFVGGDATLGGSAFGDWADYVFDSDYQLMPLSELQEYVTEAKHLPGVPTTDYVVSSGLSIGNIAKTLLLKIEELTLYIFQLNARITELEG